MASLDDLKTWWTKLQTKLEAHLHRLSSNRLDPEDLLQELVMLAILRVKEFKNEEHFRNWCYQRLTWLYLDYMASSGQKIKPSEATVAAATTHEDIEDEQARNIDLSEAIKTLSEKEQTAINLYLQGYSGQEIGTKLSITESGAHKLLARAKHTLIQKIGGHYE